MLKAIILDLDNTLIDFYRFKQVSCEAAVKAMISAGLKMSKKKALEEIYKIYDEDGMEDPLIFQKFLKRMTGKVDYGKLAHAINAYRNARASTLTAYPEVIPTLKKLKKQGFKLAIVSDAPKIKAWIRLTAMKIDGFFDVVVALEDTGRLKPSRLPFRAALKSLKVKPSECLMVGDNYKRDIVGAKRMGMHSCLAAYSLKWPGRKEHLMHMTKNIIRSFDEVLDVVDDLN